MDISSVGRWMFFLGLTLALVGAILLFLGRLPGLKNLGHLPGDIHLEGRGISCFCPLTTMILLSLLLSLALNLALRLLNR